MKVKELIEVLQKLDPETLVLVDGYEGDYDTPQEAVETIVREQVSEWYYGDYRNCSKDNAESIKAIYLPR
jgi:hypothetical protein